MNQTFILFGKIRNFYFGATLMYIHTYIFDTITTKLHKWRDLQFVVDSEGQIFESLFYGRFIYAQSFCQKYTERKMPKNILSFEKSHPL